MSVLGTSFEARIRRAGILVIAGLLVVLPTLFWNRALSFVLFSSLGLALCGAGILLFLYSALTRGA